MAKDLCKIDVMKAVIQSSFLNYHSQPPRVTALAPLPVHSRGAQAAITKSVLQIEDPDNAADGLVMVLEPPRHGRLTRLHSGRALGRFKLEELSREQIQYVHDGSEGAEDATVLQINDGHSFRNVLLQVHINQKVLLISNICKIPYISGTFIQSKPHRRSHDTNHRFLAAVDYSANTVGPS